MPTKPRFLGWFSAKTPLGVKEWIRHSAALGSFFARVREKRTGGRGCDSAPPSIELPGSTKAGVRGGTALQITQSRRQFLTTLSLAAGDRLVAAPAALAAEGALETTSVRLANRHSLCNA